MENSNPKQRKNPIKGTLRSRLTGQELFNDLGKKPPQEVEMEEAVLGALMLEKEALTNVIEILRPESFYKESHQRIYSAILSLFQKSEPIDILTVSNELRATGQLEFVGGSYQLTQLTSRINSAANIEYHARIIAQQAIKREMIRVATEIHKEAYEDTTDVFALLDRAEQSLFKVSESNIRKNFSRMTDLMREAIEELNAKKNHKDGLTGVASGFSGLDRVTSGWQRSDLVILAARPAMGKTAFVISAARNAAVEFGHGVAIFSLEMSSIQLVNRLISAEAELESEKIKKGNLAEYEWQQLHSRIGRLSEAPIFIDDTPALSVLELRAKCRRLKAQHDIQMVIIDYLQLMTGDTSSRGNREQEIASISRALKNLAKELNVPVIALSQLSRAVETRGGDKRPQLSDLRESGSIEQDADMVLFLYRPEYYGITEDEEGRPLNGLGEVIIAKHRNGSLENVYLRFIGKYTKFMDPEMAGFNDASLGQGGPAGGGFEITRSSKINSGPLPEGSKNDFFSNPGNSESPF
ncbi:replicative DNA helicase [Catalinimonas alkaloidigena]|uniref:Replicative DNA helicase n=1 Tax=Catalinimonas alkaloidigena TaxID=1075417 RepID=A0A1G9RCW1_9BACT|nr:replicative DNA helicase [Catalinimonas alkaloidigena]SDM21149.1 replicative DNA helicase [Catalinimonas alkaloidigena]